MGNKFEYNYSAPTEEERREIESIKEAYSPDVKEKSGMERLRELDKKVKTPPLICALVTGIAGALIFGLGLTCVIEWERLVVGIVISVVGAIVMGVTPYIYKVFFSRQKKKYASEILSLSNALLNAPSKNVIPSGASETE